MRIVIGEIRRGASAGFGDQVVPGVLHETLRFSEPLGFANAGDPHDVWRYVIIRRGTIELHVYETDGPRSDRCLSTSTSTTCMRNSGGQASNVEAPILMGPFSRLGRAAGGKPTRMRIPEGHGGLGTATCCSRHTAPGLVCR